jgi:hypothetical protein
VSTPTTAPPSPSSPQRSRRRRGRIFFRLLFGICLAAVIGSFVALKTSSRVFLEPSVSMADTIMPGDRVFVVPTGQVHRGDIIVEGQGGDASDDLYIRRVIGLPGDHVVCCDAQGRITVNGKPLNETYLYPAGLVALGVSLVAWPLLIVLIIFVTISRRIRRRRAKSRAPVPDPTETPGSGIPPADD